MRIFNNDADRWGGKVNFADERDVIVGFDLGQSCCEDFGWFFTSTEPTAENVSKLQERAESTAQVDNKSDFPDWFFDPAYCKEYEDRYGGGYVVFQLTHERRERDEVARRKSRDGENPRMWLVLYNIHNGYYSHGFSITVNGALDRESSI